MQVELKPLAGRARWAVIGLVAVIVSDILAIGSDLLEIDLMGRVIDGEDVSMDELGSNDDRQAVFGLLTLGVFVASIVFFLRWFHAAYANLSALGQTTLRFKAGWAIGAWFIPILNLWRPKQIANDIWRGSRPDAPAFHEASWKDEPIPPLLGFWWAAWIVSLYLGNFATRAWFGTDTAEDIRTAGILDSASLATDAIAAILAIFVLRQLTARQAERAERVAAGASGATIDAT